MKKKPNIIYILADDMGYGDVSAFNEFCPFKTRHLDQMCREGLSFTDAHATSAVCTPSRYGILTGRYNWRSKLKEGVMSGYDRALIEPGRLTVSEFLKENGYFTAAIGKWHLGMDFAVDESFCISPDYEMCPGVDYSAVIKNSPVDYGFQYYYGIAGSLDMPPYIYIENNHFTNCPDRETENKGKKTFWRKGPTGPDFVHEEVLPRFTEKVLEKIEEYREHPFFIYFAMPAPHTPILPGKEFVGKSGTTDYGDFVLMCDDVAGRILDKVKELGLEEDTIIIYTSDNGCAPMADFDELARYGHNPSYIFRGHKADIYEGGHRVPFIVKWKGTVGEGKKCDRMICLCDLFATVAECIGVRIPENAAEDSVSNLPLWLNPDGPEVRQDIIHQSFDGSLSIRRGRFKLEMCPGSGGWSYPVPGEEKEGEPAVQLYNLEMDISEQQNVIQVYPAIANQLKNLLAGYVKNGRSTPGIPQKNNGEEIWERVKWLEEYGERW